MTPSDKQLITDFAVGKIQYDEVLERFSVDLRTDTDFVRNEFKKATESSDPGIIEIAIALFWFSENISNFTGELNKLLINPNHFHHQRIAKALQSIKSPSTIPFVRKVMETGFDYLDYTCSDSGAIAKWFSWLLYSIGTKEAIALIKEYTSAKDSGIADEMRYRLNLFNNSL